MTVGSGLGIVIAYVSYRQYYPSVTKTNSHLPYICIPNESDISSSSPLLPIINPGKDSALKIV